MIDLARAVAMDRIAHDFEYAYSLMGAVDLEGRGGLQELYGPPPPHLKIYHDTIRAHLDAGERHIVLAAATGTLKSTVLNVITVQELLRPNPKVLFATVTPAVRDATVDTLRETMAMLYGKEGELWRNEKFKLPDWQPSLKWPNFLGATTDGAVEGYRAGLGLGDDISDQKSEWSEPYRARVSRWMRKTFTMRMDEDMGGRFPQIIVGSFWGVDDILCELMEAGWTTDIFPLFGCDAPKELDKYPNVTHHGRDYDHLWPERHGTLTPEAYMVREKMISQDFELRLQCNPWGATGRRFKPEWIQTFGDLHPDILPRLQYSVGDDPAVSEKELASNSEQSIVVLGHDPQEGTIYVMENIAGYWGWDELIEIVNSVYKRYRPNPWVIEKSSVSKRYIQYLKAHGPMNEHEVMEQDPGGPKDTRIDSLAPHIRDHTIVFHEECQALIKQLLAHPGGKKKDRADSLEVGARRLLDEGTRPDYEVYYG